MYTTWVLFLGLLIVYVSTDNETGAECGTYNGCGIGIDCKDGFCDCASHGLEFDKTKKTCVKLVGTSCSSPVEDNFPCISHSHCDNVTGICVCDMNEFSPTSYSQCRLNYGANCWQGRPSCNPEKFLRCNTEWKKFRCTCANDDEQVYSHRARSCLTRPGERCELTPYGIFPPCVSNAICIPHSYGKERGFGRCECRKGFETVNSSFCLPMHGHACDKQDGCAPRQKTVCKRIHPTEPLICACSNAAFFNPTGDTCQEVFRTCSSDQEYDPELRICRVKATRPCDEFKLEVCVPHAVCENGSCQCTANFIPNDRGQCLFHSKSRNEASQPYFQHSHSSIANLNAQVTSYNNLLILFFNFLHLYQFRRFYIYEMK